MKINNLTKKFGKKTIFNNASFDFANNSVTYIIGESGVGKTTLLRIIAGLDKDFKGEIVNDYSKIAYVFQEPRLFSNLTVSENVRIVSDSSSISVDDALNLVELSEEKDSLPDSLSGGMKMRLSLARALYYGADIVLMDEPFSALDDDLKERILPKIFKILKDKIVIIVSHNLNEASKYADNIINLNNILN